MTWWLLIVIDFLPWLSLRYQNSNNNDKHKHIPAYWGRQSGHSTKVTGHLVTGHNLSVIYYIINAVWPFEIELKGINHDDKCLSS